MDTTTYTELGFDTATKVCELCGKKELRGTVILAKLENGELSIAKYGTSCAERALAGFVGAHGIMVEKLNDTAWLATHRVVGKPAGRVRVRVVIRDGAARCQCGPFILNGTCGHAEMVTKVSNIALGA